MRYLWVEDFGEDSEDQEDKRELWEKYFEISENVLVYSLEEALVYLDDADNLADFDMILLDIRFPVLKDESAFDIDQIYKKYFSDIITRGMFDKYAESEELQDASSGILLFLALIYRYGYRWNNIAFISANIDDEDLSAITIMKEILTKAQYGEKISFMEDAQYQTKYNDLFSSSGLIYEKLGCIDENLKIPEYTEETWNQTVEFYKEQIKKLYTFQEKINESITEKNKGLKYCSVRHQFESIGLRMPLAFEKPNDESLKKCWLFYDWKEKRNNAIIETRRTIIDVCRYLKQHIHDNVKSFLQRQKSYNDDDSIMDEKSINMYLEEIIRNATNVPVVYSSENEYSYAIRIVSCISAPWVNINMPKIDRKQIHSYYDYACYSVMYLTRNWIAHQGIKNVDIQFAAFVFLISIRGIFDVSRMSREDSNKWKEFEKNLVRIFENNPIKYDSLNISLELEKVYNKLKEEVQNAIPGDEYSGPMRIPRDYDPRALISAKGHEHSRIRESVSSTDLYKVFSLSMYYGDRNSNILSQNSIKDVGIKSILEGIYSYIK